MVAFTMIGCGVVLVVVAWALRLVKEFDEWSKVAERFSEISSNDSDVRKGG